VNTSDVVFEGHGNAGMAGDFEAVDSDFGGGAWVPMQPSRALAVAVLTVASQKAGRRARRGCDRAEAARLPGSSAGERKL